VYTTRPLASFRDVLAYFGAFAVAFAFAAAMPFAEGLLAPFLDVFRGIRITL
jgi:hypothetical protein